MAVQCPQCSSYNDRASTFCGQCGGALSKAPPRRERSRSKRGWLVAVLIVVGGAIAYLSFGPDGPESRDGTASVTPPAGDDESAPPGEALDPDAERSARRPPSRASGADDAPEPLSVAKIRERAEASLVVLELHDGSDRPMADVPGALVTEDGVVLCRLDPLLGAVRGVGRLPGVRQARVSVSGVSFLDVDADLALVRLDLRGERAISLPIAESPPEQLFQSGDALYVFTGSHLRQTTISDPYFESAGGLFGVRLERRPVVVPESFLAVDVYGYLTGICRPMLGDRVVTGRESLTREQVGSDEYRVLVVPASVVVEQLVQPSIWTLPQLTRELFTGTFRELAGRAERAYRRQAWEESIELYSSALGRVETDAVGEDDREAASKRLLESFLREMGQLSATQRVAEAVELAEAALEWFPQDASLWFLLGDYRLSLGELRSGLDALLESRAIESSQRVEKRLEQAYLQFAAQSSKNGDARLTEGVLIEGYEQLPRSGALPLELAKLYHEWEAYDDAIRLYRDAAELDRSLVGQVDAFLQRIDDALKNRDALVIPIPAGSRAIRTNVALDGRWEFPFIIDTGATHTTIPYGFATQMGYKVEAGERVQINTAGGALVAHKIVLQSVGLHDYSVRNLEVIVLPDKVRLQSGLLGINFLNFFKYSVDSGAGEFRLERR